MPRMIKRLLTCFVLAVSFLSVSKAMGQESLIFIGWDGVGSDKIESMLPEGKLPNLKKFLDSGGHYVPMRILSAQTATVPQWTKQHTGLVSEETLAYGNVHAHKRIDPVKVAASWRPNLGIHFMIREWYKSLPYDWTMAHHIQNLDYKVGWFVSKSYVSHKEKNGPISAVAVNADRYLLTEPENDPMGYITQLTNAAIQFIKANPKFFVFLLHNPDYFGHRPEEYPGGYDREIRRADAEFGRILAVLPEGSKVVLTADHGFDIGRDTHLNAWKIWMATNLEIDPYFYRSGRRVAESIDVTATIMDHFGVTLPEPLQPRGQSLLK